MAKVIVELSGGVDSAITAYLLLQKGHQVDSAFFWAWDSPQVEEDKKMAAAVARQLSIPFQVVDLRKEYRQRVIENFFGEYARGRVPSPDVSCNREIKFGLFLDWAKKEGYDQVATGHYAKLKKTGGRLAIFRPLDESKDQTYFLYQLKEGILPYILWSLGDKKKEEVKKLARRLGLSNWNRPESMGICFIGPVKLDKFLNQYLPIKRGEVVLPSGQVVGYHKGVYFYALGQRHNLEIKRPSTLPRRYLYPEGGLKPLYVIKKDLATNRLVVSLKEDCWIKKISFSQLTTVWPEENIEGKEVLVRLRNLGSLIPATIEGRNIQLKEPAFITSPGQPVVFYTPDGRLVGGGIVEEVE